jgi:hypothetical protein
MRVSGIIRDFHFELPGSLVYIHSLLFDSHTGERGRDDGGYAGRRIGGTERVYDTYPAIGTLLSQTSVWFNSLSLGLRP